MMNQKRAGKRGRPPKYIRDDKGREIVGISYHDKIRQYYITHSKPRIYLGTGKNVAIDQFNQWVQIHDLPEEVREEAKRKDENYQKALELIKHDYYIRDLFLLKASELLDQRIVHKTYLSIDFDNTIKMAILNTLNTTSDYHVLTATIAKTFDSRSIPDVLKKVFKENEDEFVKSAFNFIYSTVIRNIVKKCVELSNIGGSLSSDIDKFITAAIHAEAKAFFQKECQDSMVWERAYDLIMEDPIKASKVMGIKEVAYLALCQINEERPYPDPRILPMPWWFVWHIYECYVAQDAAEEVIRGIYWKSTGGYIGSDKDIQDVSVNQITKNMELDHYSTLLLVSRSKH
jgi:hypothetical protein